MSDDVWNVIAKHLAEYEWLWSGDMSKFKNLSDPGSVYLSMVDGLSFNNK